MKTASTNRLSPREPARLVDLRPSRVRHQVTWWLAVAAVLAYLCRNSLVVAESQLRADLGLSESQMGFILGPAFFWTYALAQIPTAWLGERYGTRRCLPLFAAAWSLASAMIAMASGFGMVLTSRLASGVSQAGLFPSSVRSLAVWKPQAERASASGILGAAMSVGGAIGAGLTGWMLGWMPATTIFALLAIPGLIWSVGFWIWFRDEPGGHRGVNRAELRLIAGQDFEDAEEASPAVQPERTRRRSRMWLEMVTSPAAWLIFGQQFFRAAGYAFFTSWFATYLMQTRGVSTAQSGMLTAMPLLATVLGSMTGGYASDAILRATGSLAWSRKGVAGISLSLCACLVFSAFFVADATTAVLVISVGAFLAALAAPCGYTVTMDMGGNHVASVFSAMNMLGNFGAGLIPWVVPPFKRWIEHSPALLRLSHDNPWNSILLLFAAMYVGGALCWFLLSPRGTVFDQSLLKRKDTDDTRD